MVGKDNLDRKKVTLNPLKVKVEDVIDGIDEQMNVNTALHQVIKDEFKNEAKRSRSRSDWADLVILYSALDSIDNTIVEIEDLSKEYRNVERNIIMRVYPPYLLKAGIVKPKTLIGGRERVDVNMFYESFRMFTIELKEYVTEIKEKNKNHIATIRDILTKMLKGTNVKIDKLSDDKIVALNRLLIVQETKRSEDLYAATARTLKIASYVCDEKNVKFEFPKQSQVDVAKDLRDLLIKTQSIGRQAEIFFTYYLGKLLYQHPQLRKDYVDVEKYTNALFQSLSVTRAEFNLDGRNVADALKKIIKSLYNIRGDFVALRLVLSMNVRKGRGKNLIDDWFKTVGKKQRKKSGE